MKISLSLGPLKVWIGDEVMADYVKIAEIGSFAVEKHLGNVYRIRDLTDDMLLVSVFDDEDAAIERAYELAEHLGDSYYEPEIQSD